MATSEFFIELLILILVETDLEALKLAEVEADLDELNDKDVEALKLAEVEADFEALMLAD